MAVPYTAPMVNSSDEVKSTIRPAALPEIRMRKAARRRKLVV
jgi:hypothetical protein